jgi:beta-phosphoglucomutase
VVKAVLFDLDGTLCACGPAHFMALNEALTALGCSPITPQEHAREFDGLPTREKLRRLAKYGRVRVSQIEELCRLKQQNTRTLLAGFVAFDPTIYCTVAGIAASGRKWGVVTNAVPETALLCLTKLGLPQFDVLVTNNEAMPKPDPAPYELACRRLGLEPSQCLAIEDGKYGIKSARKAGLWVLEVKSPADVTPVNVWKAIEEAV